MLFGLITVVAEAQQAARPTTLRIVVRDATDLAIPGAVVTLVTVGGGTPRTVAANERGEAIFENLPAGDYSARVESPGFTSIDLREIRVRGGAQTNRNVSLAIASLAEEIDVSPPEEDTQLLGAFTEQLTAEQIAALPDDPEELAQVLQQLVGDNADIRVNGFSGGRLPPGRRFRTSASGTTPPRGAATAALASKSARAPAADAGRTPST